MFNRTFFCILLCFSVGCAIIKPKIDPEQDPIYWQRVQPLSWEDFKAEPDLGSLNGAISDVSIIIKMFDYPIEEATVDIRSVFYPYGSWVNPYTKTQDMLTHEIYHFHIEEIFARKMRQQFDTTVFSPYDLRKQWWKIYDGILTKCISYHEEYDYEIRLPKGEENQVKWQEKIDRELDELKEYADPVVKIEVKEIEERD